MGFGTQVRNWLWKGGEPLLTEFTGQGEKIQAELAELKKLVRRQGIQQESLSREIAARMDAAAAGTEEEQAGPSQLLMELAESLFHLRELLDCPESCGTSLEAVDIVWEKLAAACEEAGLRIVCELGVPYDNRVHEALDRAPSGEAPTVKSVAVPGFIYQGRVVRPARVTLSGEIVTTVE